MQNDAVKDYEYRFNGIAKLYGSGFANFRTANVAVVGLGGVGSWVAEALARSGIGNIALYDLDEVCLSNVNRQLPALTQNVGKAKIAVIAERIKQINPYCNVSEHLTWVLPSNIPNLIAREYDFVIDACDNVPTKIELADWCKKNKIGFIACGSSGGKTDATKITICDLAKTIQDPLLAKVRTKLRKDKYGYASGGKNMGIKVVTSSQAMQKSKTCDNLSGNLDCGGGYGSCLPVTGTFGFMAANFALDYLAKS